MNKETWAEDPLRNKFLSGSRRDFLKGLGLVGAVSLLPPEIASAHPVSQQSTSQFIPADIPLPIGTETTPLSTCEVVISRLNLSAEVRANYFAVFLDNPVGQPPTSRLESYPNFVRLNSNLFLSQYLYQSIAPAELNYLGVVNPNLPRIPESLQGKEGLVDYHHIELGLGLPVQEWLQLFGPPESWFTQQGTERFMYNSRGFTALSRAENQQTPRISALKMYFPMSEDEYMAVLDNWP